LRSTGNWDETRLWKELLSRGEAAAPERRLVERVLPETQRILRAAGTAPTDFTLHDADHSFRVAERIAALWPELGQGAAVNVVLALLAAYIHDIGMTPAVGLIQPLFLWLCTGDSEGLGHPARQDLQNWLDGHAEGVEPPLAPRMGAADGLREAESLIADYARARHNEWSAAWIAASLDDDWWYPGWKDDLRTLCMSHHEGYERLRSTAFDPRLTAGQWLHLRHCASLLRVADILEFDPERTPRVLFSHRDVRASSAIYWAKDHYLSFSLESDGGVVIAARPNQAVLHKAILETIAAVDAELQLCRRLDDETHFETAPNSTAHLPHRWPWEAAVRADVQPREGSYVYVEGTFRPDPHRVLALLGGMALYQDRWAALRELLQNAADAVRERLACQRLELDDPLDSVEVDALRTGHQIVIEVECDEEGTWLRCQDTGVGMDQVRLTGRFLLGGGNGGSGIRSLERRCEEAGFRLERSAKFGIGALSYFLLARRMVLHSRAEFSPSITFAIDGIEDFGELRSSSRSAVGTEVRLLLHDDVAAEIAGEPGRIRDLVATLVRHMPCRLQVQGRPLDDEPIGDGHWYAGPPLEGGLPLSVQPLRRGSLTRRTAAGGPMLTSEFADAASAAGMDIPEQHQSFRGSDEFAEELAVDLPGFRAVTTEASEGADWRPVEIKTGVAEVRETPDKHLPHEARASLSWHIEEGELPGALGIWRIAVPVWRLNDGLTLAWPSGPEPTFLVPRGRAAHSWAGFAVGVVSARDVRPSLGDAILGRIDSPAVVNLDWSSPAAGELSVDRTRLTLSQRGDETIAWVRSRLKKILADLGRQAGNGTYAALHRVLLGLEDIEARGSWIVRRGRDASWRPVTTPAISRHVLPTRTRGVRLGGKPVTILEATTVASDDSLRWPGQVDAVRAVVRDGVVESIFPLIIGDPPSHPELAVLELPTEWRSVLGVALGASTYFNRDHPLVREVGSDAWEQAGAWLDARAGARAIAGPPRGVAAALLIRMFAKDINEFTRIHEPVLRGMWQVAGLGSDAELLWIAEGEPRSLRVVTPGGAVERRGLATLPLPSVTLELRRATRPS
jgi:hypothetical protein